MARAVTYFLLAALVAVVVALAVLPGVAERGLNKRLDRDHPAPGDVAKALHASATVVDLHGDTLLWQRALTDLAERGHIDLPRLQAGNVSLQVFSSVTKSPRGLNYERNRGDSDTLIALAIVQRQPLRTWFSPFERSIWHAQRFNDAAASTETLMAVRTVADLDRLLAQRTIEPSLTGGLLSIEGLHNLEGDADNLERLFDAGYRMAGLTHFFDNRLAGSMHGVDKGGLTAFGRDIVARMEALGIIVDLAHLSESGVSDVLDIVTRPVVVSHVGVRALCNNNRNLSDAQIRRIAATGGVIGIGYWPGAVCGTAPAEIAAAIRHVRDLVGVEHVALGSDFDGAVTVSFDTSELVLVTQALIDVGLSEREIRLVLGGNAVRLLRETLPR